MLGSVNRMRTERMQALPRQRCLKFPLPMSSSCMLLRRLVIADSCSARRKSKVGAAAEPICSIGSIMSILDRKKELGNFHVQIGSA